MNCCLRHGFFLFFLLLLLLLHRVSYPLRVERKPVSRTAKADGGQWDKPRNPEVSQPNSLDQPEMAQSVRWSTIRGKLRGRPVSSDKHLRLVDQLQANGYLVSESCIMAMRTVDRKDFVLPEIPPDAIYKDNPLLNSPIQYPVSRDAASSDGGRGITVSAPHMHAVALELLSSQLQAGARVLDVGSGSGYLTACFSYATQPGSYVLGVEKFEDVAINSIHNLNRHNKALLTQRAVEIHAGNIYDILRHLPKSQDELFHAIHVGAAAHIIPTELEDLLAPGGRLVIPVDLPESSGQQQVLCVVDRDVKADEEGMHRIHRQTMGAVRFVPLTLPEDQQNA